MTSSSLLKLCASPIRPDGTRTVLRPFRVADPSHEGDKDGRTTRIIDRILQLTHDELEEELSGALSALKTRHDDVDAMLDRRFRELEDNFGGALHVNEAQARLIATFFSEEFSIESAALFNPSVVPHFDQSGLPDGDVRLILSLRGIGEGHVSSVIFQTGVWHADGRATLDPRGSRATGPEVVMPDRDGSKRTGELIFPDIPFGERVVYPFLPSQGRGIEDLRLCRFVDDDGTVDYRGTFTAFNGSETRQAALRTPDFRLITARGLDGDLAKRKGAAWFPRRINGRYHMLARLDEESICLMSSADPDTWTGGQAIIRPRYPWEFVQMGNCGSPIEIAEGWLVLTHGVGRARTYCLGAALLDRDDPSRLLARTPRPLLEPNEEERGGYVPNVVYSCGGMVRDRTLLLPFGVADDYAELGTVELNDLLRAMS